MLTHELEEKAVDDDKTAYFKMFINGPVYTKDKLKLWRITEKASHNGTQKLMVDSIILIDYFRKTDKNNSRLVKHTK